MFRSKGADKKTAMMLHFEEIKTFNNPKSFFCSQNKNTLFVC